MPNAHIECKSAVYALLKMSRIVLSALKRNRTEQAKHCAVIAQQLNSAAKA